MSSTYVADNPDTLKGLSPAVLARFSKTVSSGSTSALQFDSESVDDLGYGGLQRGENTLGIVSDQQKALALTDLNTLVKTMDTVSKGKRVLDNYHILRNVVSVANVLGLKSVPDSASIRSVASIFESAYFSSSSVIGAQQPTLMSSQVLVESSKGKKVENYWMRTFTNPADLLENATDKFSYIRLIATDTEEKFGTPPCGIVPTSILVRSIVEGMDRSQSLITLQDMTEELVNMFLTQNEDMAKSKSKDLVLGIAIGIPDRGVEFILASAQFNEVTLTRAEADAVNVKVKTNDNAKKSKEESSSESVAKFSGYGPQSYVLNGFTEEENADTTERQQQPTQQSASLQDLKKTALAKQYSDKTFVVSILFKKVIDTESITTDTPNQSSQDTSFRKWLTNAGAFMRPFNPVAPRKVRMSANVIAIMNGQAIPSVNAVVKEIEARKKIIAVAKLHTVFFDSYDINLGMFKISPDQSIAGPSGVSDASYGIVGNESRVGAGQQVSPGVQQSTVPQSSVPRTNQRPGAQAPSAAPSNSQRPPTVSNRTVAVGPGEF